ncbi:MAG: acyl carrier protein [Synergistaceae bacterium]|jgi:acyl carrier protein|nr:acyl carrier protein [Synergistaceae bacterium]
MTEEEKISRIEEAIGLETGALTPETDLGALRMWDSVGKLFLLSMIKKEFGRDVDPSVIRGFKTVAEILLEMRE